MTRWYAQVIIGSGAGGMTTAWTLAEAGKPVLLLEEGGPKSASPPFSLQELREDYRSGGLTLSLGAPIFNFGEGRALGGGTAVNSGYWVRARPQSLAKLAETWKIAELSDAALSEDYDRIEAEVRPVEAAVPGELRPERWLEAARKLGYETSHVHFAHGWDPQRREMRRRSAWDLWSGDLARRGVEVRQGCRVRRLEKSKGSWILDCVGAAGERQRIECESVFVCGGALESAALLRRSGIAARAGDTLGFHAFVRAIGFFPWPINRERSPFFPWKFSSGEVTIGHSPSAPHLLALGSPELKGRILEEADRMASFYASVPIEGAARVRAPGRDGTFVYGFADRGQRAGLNRAREALAGFLREVGATEVHPVRAGVIQSVHLYGTCPMGEDLSSCITDSWGRVHGQEGLRVNDSSLLGSSPGANPQATIMAIARRNTRHFLLNR